MSDSGRKRVHLIAQVVLLSLAVLVVAVLATGSRESDQRQEAGIIGPNNIITDSNLTVDWAYTVELPNEQDVTIDGYSFSPFGRVVGITDPNQSVRLDITDINILTDETIVRLIESGRVCEVITHAWKSGCNSGPGCLLYHYGSIRHCVICGKEQTQALSAWK